MRSGFQEPALKAKRVLKQTLIITYCSFLQSFPGLHGVPGTLDPFRGPQVRGSEFLVPENTGPALGTPGYEAGPPGVAPQPGRRRPEIVARHLASWDRFHEIWDMPTVLLEGLCHF